MLQNPNCLHDGSPLRRDVRPLTVTYKGQSGTVDAPGWYCDEGGEAILNGGETRDIDGMLNHLKVRVEGLLLLDRDPVAFAELQSHYPTTRGSADRNDRPQA